MYKLFYFEKMQPPKFNITGLQHIGIPVTDLNTSTEYYKQLGFSIVMEASFDFKGEKGQCVMMRSGDMLLEFYQFPANELTAIKNRKDGHIDHIAFNVTNIDETFSECKRAGYTILEESPVFLQFWRNGCKYFNILGPDGERLEFNQVLE